jgi:hypothetical protein
MEMADKPVKALVKGLGLERRIEDFEIDCGCSSPDLWCGLQSVLDRDD